MCWNEHVSINTFLTTIFVLLLIAYNNSTSQYKIKEFDNKYLYIFTFVIVSMQFVEFVLWRNLKNTKVNELFSKIGLFALVLQPFASLMLIKNVSERKNMILFYGIPASIYFLYNLIFHKFRTLQDTNGHLIWDWTERSNITKYITSPFWLFFFYYGLLSSGLYFLSIASFILFIIMYYNYYTYGSSGSMWCWVVNIIMLYYLAKIVIYLPYKEKITK